MNFDMILIPIVTINTIPILALSIFSGICIVYLIIAWNLVSTKIPIAVVQIDDIIQIKAGASPFLGSLLQRYPRATLRSLFFLICLDSLNLWLSLLG